MMPVQSAGELATFARAIRAVARAPDQPRALECAVEVLRDAGASVLVQPIDADATTLPHDHAMHLSEGGGHRIVWSWDHPEAATLVEALLATVDAHPPAAASLFEERQHALSQLTSGLAHEVNNPLAAVLANLELARRHVSDRLKKRASYSWLDELHSELDDARLAADRIHQIVRQLRLFHRARADRDHCELRHAVDCVLQFQGRALRSRGRFHRDDPCDYRVAAGINDVTHALFSALSHAYHRMPLGQRSAVQLTLSSRLDEGGAVVVRLTHTGQLGGPSPASASVAATAAARAHARFLQHGDDHGQHYELHFVAAKQSTPTVPVRQQTARVLVVDDEPLIGKAVSRMLADHDVTVCTHPADGLERAAREEWDLVLLDMSLPPSSGRAVYEALVERSPETARRVVFTSGGIADSSTRAFLDRIPNAIVDKPFDHARIRALVREMLERKS